MDPNQNPINANTRMTFAGVAFKTTKHSKVRKPALIKILRSGKVKVVCCGKYTDDYAWDAAINFGRGELPPEGITGLADDIEGDSSGWWCSAHQQEAGTLRLGCHSFKSYSIKEVAE